MLHQGFSPELLFGLFWKFLILLIYVRGKKIKPCHWQAFVSPGFRVAACSFLKPQPSRARKVSMPSVAPCAWPWVSSGLLQVPGHQKRSKTPVMLLISSGVAAAVPGPAAAEEQPSGGFSSTLAHGAAGGTMSGWRKLGTRVGWSCGWGVTLHCCPPTCSSHLAGCAGQAGLTALPYFLTLKWNGKK